MRNALAALLGFLLTFLCATALAAQQPAPRSIESVAVDTAELALFNSIRATYTNEKVLCLYGHVQDNEVNVDFVRPTLMVFETPDSASYVPCAQVRGFGSLQYLGTWHFHKPDGDWYCQFSGPDMNSFIHDDRAVIDLLTCSSGTKWRSKL